MEKIKWIQNKIGYEKIFMILLLIIFLFSYDTIYASKIKKIDEMTTNELIEYGRQLEIRKQEMEEYQKNIQVEANNKFNEIVQKEKQEIFLRNIIIITLAIIVIILFIFLLKKSNQNNNLLD